MTIFNSVYWWWGGGWGRWKPWENTVLYYSFDEDTASTSYDGVWSENWTWYNDSWTYQAVTKGKCCILWGVNKYMIIPQPFTYPTTDFTFSFWVNYTDNTPNQSRAIFSKWNWASSSSGAYLMIYQLGGKIYWAVPYARDVFMTGTLNDGNWHNVVLTKSGTSWNAYVDGNSSPVSTVTFSANIDWATYQSYIGTNNNSTGVDNVGYHWLLDEFIVENVAWTGQEVTDYYNLTKWYYWL